MNESNTKFKVVGPMLEVLGWDSYADIELEFPVRVGSTTAKVDYALHVDGKPVVFVEAKGLDGEIGRDEADQVISYGRYQDVKWVVVTNGRSTIILNTKWGKTYEECLFAKIDVEEYVDKKDILLLLSKEKIQSAEIDSFADEQKRMQTFVGRLEKEREDVSKKISSTLKKLVDKPLYSRIDRMSMDLVDYLVNQIKLTTKTPSEVMPKTSRPKLTARTPSEVMPKPRRPAEGTQEIRRSEIKGNPQDEVAIFPSTQKGIEFLIRYNAWGFVKIRRRPRYFALYVSKPYSCVLFFGEIERITDPLLSKDAINNISPEDMETYRPGKQILYLKRGTLAQLSDPIKIGGKRTHIQGMIYTTLEKVIHAKDTGAFFSSEPAMRKPNLTEEFV
jgi:predicted type IV restriction endonuclease